MIPRMTTVGTLKNYRYDLNRSNNTLAKAMQTVTTRRNFNTYAEDPALAVRCFQIRRSQHRAESQLTVNDSLRHKYDVAWSSLENVSQDLYSQADDTSISSIIRSLSDTTGPGRLALGQSLCAKARDIAQTMNGRYGDNYVFSGADTLNPPFSWGPQVNPTYVALDGAPDATNPDHAMAFPYVADPDKVADGTLPAGTLYTDDETLAKQETLEDGTVAAVKNEAYDATWNVKYLKPDGSATSDASEAAQGLYYRGVPVDTKNPDDVAKLEYYLKDESKFIDIGLGHKELDGQVMESTVFDSALQGIYFLGDYGTKTVELEDGTKVNNIPNNVISLANELGQILQRCNKEDGTFQPGDEERYNALVQAFEDSNDMFRERWTEMDTQSGFLRDNSELLQETSDSLVQQFTELEEADPAAAISEFMFAKYCYDAALKVGNSVLSQSLMDYMSF